jgi:hypothetical protein
MRGPKPGGLGFGPQNAGQSKGGDSVPVRGTGRVVEATRNLRALEWAKAELISDGAHVLRALVEGDEDSALQGLADSILVAYLLARRLGVAYPRLSQRVRARVEELIREGHEMETWYGDLSELLRHLPSGAPPLPEESRGRHRGGGGKDT